MSLDLLLAGLITLSPIQVDSIPQQILEVKTELKIVQKDNKIVKISPYEPNYLFEEEKSKSFFENMLKIYFTQLFEKTIIDAGQEYYPGQRPINNPLQSRIENKTPYEQIRNKKISPKLKQKNKKENFYYINKKIESQINGRKRAQQDIYTSKKHYLPKNNLQLKKQPQQQISKIHGTKHKKNHTQQPGWKQHIYRDQEYRSIQK